MILDPASPNLSWLTRGLSGGEGLHCASIEHRVIKKMHESVFRRRNANAGRKNSGLRLARLWTGVSDFMIDSEGQSQRRRARAPAPHILLVLAALALPLRAQQVSLRALVTPSTTIMTWYVISSIVLFNLFLGISQAQTSPHSSATMA